MLANDLIGARAAAEALLSDTCQVLTRGTNPDGAGGQIEAWSVQALVPCRIASLNLNRDGEKGKTGDRIDARTTHFLTLPAGTAIRAVDRVLVAGVTYEVTAVRDRTDEIVRRIEIKALG